VTYISSGFADVLETLDVGITNSVLYSASKAGGNSVITKFGAELKGEGFVFLSIAPGGVEMEGLVEGMEGCKYFRSLECSYSTLVLIMLIVIRQ
jgi:NAD(P)-dependent dehydrogenase (short-subunit alcohol dehydrogenase family)